MGFIALILLIGMPILTIILRQGRWIKVTSAISLWSGIAWLMYRIGLHPEFAGASLTPFRCFLWLSLIYALYVGLACWAYARRDNTQSQGKENLITSRRYYWHPWNIWNDNNKD